MNGPRRKYQWKQLKDLMPQQVVLANAVEIAPVKSEMKVSKAGNEYQSNLLRLNFYNDSDRWNCAWFVQLFQNYDGELITIPKFNELHGFARMLLNDLNKDEFVLDFEAFRLVGIAALILIPTLVLIKKMDLKQKEN